MATYAFTLNNFEYFLLILVRVSAFVYIAPFFGQSGIPNQTKIGFAAFISMILYSVVDRPELNYASAVGYALVVLSEGITGLLIGLASNICNSIVVFAGHIIDMDIGLSMANEFNQDMGTEVSMTGNLYYYGVLMLLIATNLHTYLIQTLSDSFSLIPIGGANFNMDSLLSAMMTYMADLMIIGFRIFLPFFACIMILNCVLGVMAKVAPQMNMFAVGMQLKVLTGFIVMVLVAFMLSSVSSMIFDEIKKLVNLFVQGMS
ncbi:MAG: flagellar biosynthetic protein FliR [Clostridiales bacterium]|nr:flagellar biosynthetic protein FliR [Clostridiales bacterium]